MDGRSFFSVTGVSDGKKDADAQLSPELTQKRGENVENNLLDIFSGNCFLFRRYDFFLLDLLLDQCMNLKI